ncbi:MULTISPECIES: aminotransferase class I/II-fold pyridoxal phosphate-dependent enzyme [unclassified Bradyrhizobium]|uniref:pyridoxal phosphate-dependent aminotransferase n=1 Tax=unclassified Bradyrhizobium TaxID=2631580 RepID=UPI00247A3F5F|nr:MULTISPECIES: aminotransferase class I/II-fold pyridoxal phosphate-dependent enzyme [unclassified Bradyrhizobium]WGS19132.1 aminotransferase class I/II-fold pyridoxal phosphate-dependent enzyme [Bradyrhizobium sp. ISRA463]WGS25970.1 aminotransferase class I/II-fold pyridoxal phosphate-dependent enzyme [Bradyrhizobium sp. ISRA464]
MMMTRPTMSTAQINVDLRSGNDSDLVNRFPGGYWKYDIKDFVLLVNPYFPPQAFLDELKDALPRLITCYPSPNAQMVELLADVVKIPANNLVVCNGVAELLPIFLGRLGMKIAVPVPSFNPYETTALPGRLSRFILPPPDFELDVHHYAAFARANRVSGAVVISPNNPTSRMVRCEDLLSLASALRAQQQLLLLDESFIEFSEAGHRASLENHLFEFPNVIILKSLGKIYGTCGLRIGYAASANEQLINDIRAALPTWNVNTCAEFFLSKLPYLTHNAKESWARAGNDRDKLYTDLLGIDGMKVLKPDANFVFCELPPHWPNGDVIASRLLKNRRILIRHNGGKTLHNGKRYLRIASRTGDDNEFLVEALRDIAN